MGDVFSELFVIIGCKFARVVDNPEIEEIFKEFVVIVACSESNIGCNPDTSEIGTE